MNVEDYEKAYYGKNYEYVMKNSKQDVDMMKKNFLKKYPNADMTKFEFFANFDRNGNFLGSQIFFKNNELLSTDIKNDTFKNYKNMTKYLYSNNVKH